jgi:hypothetical protein
MQAARVLTLVLLSVPAALWSQQHVSQFKDLISSGRAGARFLPTRAANTTSPITPPIVH